MEQQQLITMLSIEKSLYLNKSLKSHPKRRLIADSLHKVRIYLIKFYSIKIQKKNFFYW